APGAVCPPIVLRVDKAERSERNPGLKRPNVRVGLRVRRPQRYKDPGNEAVQRDESAAPHHLSPGKHRTSASRSTKPEHSRCKPKQSPALRSARNRRFERPGDAR